MREIIPQLMFSSFMWAHYTHAMSARLRYIQLKIKKT